MIAPGSHEIDQARTCPEDGLKIMLVQGAPLPKVARVLSRDGHDVLELADDESPSRLLAVFAPDVIVIGVLDAPPTCRRLRCAAPDVAIVTIVAGEDSTDRVRALEAGADDCLGTPFAAAELVARVRAARRRVLLRSGGDRSPRRRIGGDGEMSGDCAQRWHMR